MSTATTTEPIWARPAETLPDLEPAEVQRYARHLLLPAVMTEGQRRLKAARVLVVGSGGLGSPVLLYLAAAGVGTLGLIDHDRVDVSNLQRQLLHTDATIGQPKVDSATERLRGANPHIELVPHDVVLRSDNALELLSGWDLIIDGTDNFPTRYLINDACALLDIPWIYGSIHQFEGQVSVFNHQGGPTYRDLFPQPPPPGMVPSCAEGGVLGVLPGVVGSLQATEAVKVLLGIGEVLSGRLLVYDALSMETRPLQVRRQEDAPEITELIDYEAYCGVPVVETAASRAGADEHLLTSEQSGDGSLGEVFDVAAASQRWVRQGSGWREIPPRDVAGWREGGDWNPYVLDVRSPMEAQIADLPFKDELVPHMMLGQIVDELPRDRDLLVYCRSGSRSEQVCEALVSQVGFDADRMFNLEGGLLAWQEQIDPTMARY